MARKKAITTAQIVSASEALRSDGVMGDVYGHLANTGATGMGNTMTGLGTRRDKGSHASIPPVINLLSVDQRVALLRSSRICRRAVESFPISAGGNGWLWTFGGAASASLTKKLDAYCDRLQLKKTLVEASIEARWHGDGFILIGAADGLDLNKPLGRVRTIEWLEVYGHHECIPAPGYFHQQEPDYYQLTGLKRNKIVHGSRIIRLSGDRLTGYAFQRAGGRNDSVLQTMLGAYIQFRMAIDSSAGMLADYSVFLYKLDGLANLVMSGESDKLLSRFITMQMGMSVTQGLMMDAKNEDASFVSRNYTGVKDIVDALIEQLVAATDMPRTKLLGSAAQVGLGSANRGESDREDWELARKDWQINNWEEPLLRIGNVILGAADFGARGSRKDFGVMFPSGLSLSAKDQAEVRLTNAKRFKVEIDAGIVHEEEVRQSLYGSPEYSSEITLMYDLLAEQRAKEAEEAFKLQQERMPDDGGIAGAIVPGGDDAGAASKKGGKTGRKKGRDSAGDDVEAEEQAKEDADDLEKYAKISEKDLADARAAWEANPPDVQFKNVLGAGD